jgi:hypothetical protein
VQGPPGALVDGQRVGPSAGAVEREHELAVKDFTERILGDEHLQAPDDFPVKSQVDLRVDEHFRAFQASFLKPDRESASDRAVAQGGQGRAAPQRERRAEGGGGMLVAILRGVLPPRLHVLWQRLNI